MAKKKTNDKREPIVIKAGQFNPDRWAQLLQWAKLVQSQTGRPVYVDHRP